MKILSYDVGAYGAMCYFVYTHPERTLIIDPGAEPALLLEQLRTLGLRPAALAFTHGHADHISAYPELLATYPCPTFVAPEDATWCFSKANHFPPYPELTTPPSDLHPILELPSLDLGDLHIQVLPTPGHSPGSSCLLITTPSNPIGALFSGDTLFAGSIGRTDFPGGNTLAMAQSLRSLSSLPEPLPVFPGHGPNTTISREIRTNPFLSSLS